MITQDRLGRLGVFGRKLFPDGAQVARDLVSQLKVRAARELMCRTLVSTRDKAKSARVIEGYMDAILAWTRQHGWDMMISVNNWRSLLVPAKEFNTNISGTAYAPPDNEFTEGMSNLKRTLGGGSPVADDVAINSFLEPISKRLLLKYGAKNAVMRGCTDPIRQAIKDARECNRALPLPYSSFFRSLSMLFSTAPSSHPVGLVIAIDGTQTSIHLDSKRSA